MNPRYKIFAAHAFAAVLLVASVNADILINADYGSPVQSGAAVLGSAGDTWNSISGFNYSAPPSASIPLVNSSNAPSGISLVLNGSTILANQRATGGTPYDSATANLMTGWIVAEGNLTSIISGLTPYIGDAFNLVEYNPGNTGAGGGATPYDFISFGASGGNTGQNLYPVQTNRKISQGDGYVEFTGGTITANALLLQAGSDGTFAYQNGFQFQIITPAPAPEPGLIAFVALYGLGILMFHRRRG